METAFALLVGIFVALGVYLLLSRSLIRMILGVAVLGNGINLLIFVSGRLMRAVPPIVPPGLSAPDAAIANPLPQALVLTAIVIGFALFSVLLVLTLRTYRVLDADNTDAMRMAEPPEAPQPPLGY